MNSNRFTKAALLAGCALGVMSVGAHADELTTLKAQLEALQSRVNSIETPAPVAAAQESASYISFRRGSDLYKVDGPNRAGEEYSDDRGFTIAITPTADLPAPVMEVSVSGYIKGDFIYDTNQNLGRSVGAFNIEPGGGKDSNFQAHANQSRFRIKSKSDTSVGQIRTLIEGDFEGSGSASQAFRLRHAWGEWDLTPGLTFGMGQSWASHYHFAGEISTVDAGGSLGTSGSNQSRIAQVQIKSSNGPISWAVGLQNPRSEIVEFQDDDKLDDNRLPDLAARASFEVAGATIGLSGIVRELHVDADGATNANDSAFGYGVSAGIDLPLGDMFTLHATASYGDGDTAVTGSPILGAVFDPVTGKIETVESVGFSVGATFKLSEASSVNAAYSLTVTEDINGLDQGGEKFIANYMWQPVSKLRMGFEGIYSNAEPSLTDPLEDNLRLQFGTWFFF